MFGSSRPVVLNRYGRRGARFSVPRWLVLLVAGIAIGAGGIVFLQERYLPPRLSAEESSTLRASYAQADQERQRAKADLDAATKRLNAALDDKKRATAELAASKDSVDGLRRVASSLVAALPPDPRGGAVEVRAARFGVEGNALAYDVVLTRAGKPMNGVMQLAVTGASARGTEITTTLKPIAVSIGAFESLRGSAPLPEGFKPRQATISVLDGPEGRLLGRRVMYVK